MPRLTDQERTFDDVTTGAVHVLDAAGLPALTWARVAEASGMTVGAVRNRCDGDRDTLLRYTVLALRRDRLRRLRDALSWLPIPRRGLSCVLRDERADWLVPAMALIPATPPDRIRSRVWRQLLACAGASALPEPCHELLRRTTEEETAWLQYATGDEAPGAQTPSAQTPSAQTPDAQTPRDAHSNEALLRALLTGLEQAASDRHHPLPAEAAQAILRSIFCAILPTASPGRHRAEPARNPLRQLPPTRAEATIPAANLSPTDAA